jgi:hypothetical protein
MGVTDGEDLTGEVVVARGGQWFPIGKRGPARGAALAGDRLGDHRVDQDLRNLVNDGLAKAIQPPTPQVVVEQTLVPRCG